MCSIVSCHLSVFSSGLFTLPLKTYVIGGPQSFELEVALQSVSKIPFKLNSQLIQTLKPFVIDNRTHREQVLNDREREIERETQREKKTERFNDVSKVGIYFMD